jgi:hypothetical protein
VNIKEIKRLYNLVIDMQTQCIEESYIIHYIDDNGVIYPIEDIIKDSDTGYTIVWSDGEPQFANWEDLSADGIYVYKEVFWNKKQTDLK